MNSTKATKPAHIVAVAKDSMFKNVSSRATRRGTTWQGAALSGVRLRQLATQVPVLDRRGEHGCLTVSEMIVGLGHGHAQSHGLQAQRAIVNFAHQCLKCETVDPACTCPAQSRRPEQVFAQRMNDRARLSRSQAELFLGGKSVKNGEFGLAHIIVSATIRAAARGLFVG